MKAKIKVIRNIFNFSSIEELIYDILDEDLFDKEMWVADLPRFLDDMQDDEYDLDQFDEYYHQLTHNDYILYYEGYELALIAFDTKDEHDTFIDIAKASGGHVYLKDELMKMFEPYIKKVKNG